MKQNIQDKIDLLKREGHLLLAEEMEKKMASIHCFYCLDSQELWGLRAADQIFWSKLAGYNANFWIGKCFVCGEHKFLRDSMTNDIVTSSGYKMFFRDDSSFEERFKEIRRLAEPLVVKEVIPVIQPLIQPVIITESHIIQEKPDFQKVVAKTIEYKKENIGFKVGIKELVQMLGGILQAHVGIPNLPLLQEIQAVVNYESMSKNNEEVFCNSTANNEYFIFVILTDNSQVKKGNFLQMIN